MRWTAREVNRALAWLVACGAGTGVLAFAIGTEPGGWVVVAHGILGLAVLVLAPLKARIAARGIRRDRPGRATSIVLSILALVTVASGVALTTGVVDRIGPLTSMQVHVGAGIGTAVVTALHLRKRPAPRPTNPDRRRFLRVGALGAGAGVLWLGTEGVLAATGAPGADRRFTGSHDRGSFDPGSMPGVQWLDDRPPDLDPETWRVRVGDEDLDLATLTALADDTVEATLDCTGGWFATQSWRGVRLDRLVDPGEARSIVVRSATGYSRRLPVSDLDHLWLAVGYGDETLRRKHGFPARLVAPGRRGFWWVKWVTAIEPSPAPWWVQSPFPLT
ncbi:MAG: molybdopterin-dependent oxidoreductase [Acidimicrobiia bacterium]